MTAAQLREKFLKFFEARGHKILPSSSLIPENDSSVLFTTAGMHPLIPFLLGEKHPAGRRLCNVQKCLRTDDIEEVGDESHLTFFEMLGYWSLGDYFKEISIDYTFDFFTQELKIPPDKISVTVFKGDEEVPEDSISYHYWKEKIGIPEKRIFKLGKKDNWWGLEIGPCGPCTEMFYDTGKESCGPDCNPSCSCGKYIEIGNNVFMEYNRTADGRLIPLSQKNVDVGLGLERILAVINHKESVFETDLFEKIIQVIKKLSLKREVQSDSFSQLYNAGVATMKKIDELKQQAEETRAVRIIADHIKAATFILAEGLEPSNVERGYTLRRLIRRAVRYGKLIGIEGVFAFKISQPVIEIYKEDYPELEENREFIEEQLVREEEKFGKTLSRGINMLEKLVKTKKIISGKEAFDLYQSYGFPLELIKELAEEKGIKFDKEGFFKEFEKHQELSRTASTGMFKGGLASHSEKVIKYHTATHLLHRALREVLGDEIKQKGSNINEERLRFDYSYSRKPTSEQLKKVEEIVNEKIKENLPIIMKEMMLAEAKKLGAIGLFEEKYGERVKVYFIGEPKNAYSKEICAGPHVANTGILGHFKIIKEEAVSSGVRRIKAVLE